MSTTIERSPLSLWPSRALLTFVERQVCRAEAYYGDERRTEQRVMIAMPVIVQAVDEQLTPIGHPQPMVVRDVTPKGLGLVHEQPFDFERIVVRLSYPEEGTLLAAEVRWNKAMGPFYHLGCEVVKKLERFGPLEG
jgi:hypothetical protein